MGLVTSGLQSGGGTATALAPGATGSSLTLSGLSTALKYVSTQVAGADGFAVNTNGARWHIGTGATDWLESDGTTISTGLSGLTYNSFKAKLIGAVAANAAQLTLLDTTNTKSFFFIVNNTTCSIYDTSGAVEILKLTATGDVAIINTLTFQSYTDDSATPGARTVNKVRGKSAIALGASSVVITNSFVTTNSQVIATLEQNDATATFIKSVVPSGTGFTVTVNANTTAALKFSWVVIN